jgi:hypothetical protein
MRPHGLLLLTLSSFALLAACSDDNGDGNTPVTVDVSGSWNYRIDVTVANGVCAGEEDADPSTDLVTIVAIDPNGDGTYDVTASGFLGDPTAEITGTVTGVTQVGDQLTLTGSYPEDGGVTTTTHRLTIKSETRLEGTEDWSWTNGTESCPNGKADVVVTKVP